ncbi:hypothetical protein AOX55_00001142 [Sinorhizobium fredii CCBAU 25509]|nr:hypothetical protein SF83666_c09120 [Sinorhizobium fredii CCBAU 83666]AWM24418.1 hypothetical protein AOX55_00001142 [Sinorhizobium fredii CCBAU 25509]
MIPPLPCRASPPQGGRFDTGNVSPIIHASPWAKLNFARQIGALADLPPLWGRWLAGQRGVFPEVLPAASVASCFGVHTQSARTLQSDEMSPQTERPGMYAHAGPSTSRPAPVYLTRPR